MRSQPFSIARRTFLAPWAGARYTPELPPKVSEGWLEVSMSWLRKSLGLLVLSVTAGSAVTGCEENESILFIVGVLAVDRTDCVARPEQDALLLSGGTLDLLLRPSYRAALLVGSHLTERGSRDQLRTETARLSLQGATVTLTSFAGDPLPINPNPYSTLGTGFVHPGGGNEPGYGPIFVDLVPPGLKIPDQTIIAKIRVFGNTLGGFELESNEYIFPITVCRGCLIAYPTGSADTTQGSQASYRCRQVSEGAETTELEACFPGQDAVIPCDFCSAFNPACQDPCVNCSVRASNAACALTPTPEACL